VTLLRPESLLVLLVTPLLLVAFRRAPIRVTRAGGRIMLGLRFLTLALLSVALALPVVQDSAEPGRKVVIDLVDGSLSVGAGEADIAIELIESGLGKKNPTLDRHDYVFARSMKEVTNQAYDLILDDPKFATERESTSMSLSLLQALKHVRAGDAAAVILVTDGNSSDQIENVVDMYARASIPIHVIPVRSVREDGYRVSSLVSPRQVFDSDRFQIEATINSTRAGDVQVMFYRESKRIKTIPHTLSQGVNRVVHEVEEKLIGLVHYRVLVDPVKIVDQYPQTNEGHTFTEVLPIPKILRFSDRPGDSSPFVAALEHMEMKVESLAPKDFPASFKQLAAFAAVILDDVPAQDFGELQQKALADYVKSTGGGLLMLGRHHGFGPGGWAGTPIEKVLPVDLPTVGFSSSSAVCLVLDSSGSMGGAPIMAVKAATKILMRELNGRLVSVITFDHRPTVRIPMQLITGQYNDLDPLIEAIYAGGGTAFYQSLILAADVLDAAGTQYKYVIMLTDGIPSDAAYVPQAVQELARRSIQISTIGVGTNLNISLLQEMARGGSGRFYKPERLEEISNVFKQESSFIVKGEPVVKEVTKPRLKERDAIVRGLETASFPSMNEYVGTTLKERATLVLESPSQDPILAWWRHGLGKTAVFTGDSGAPSAPDWVRWDEYPKFWSQIVKFLFRARTSEYSVRARIDGESGEMTVDGIDLEGRYLNFQSLRGMVHGPMDPATGERLTQDVPLTQSEPGRYRGSFAAPVRGFYHISIHRSLDDVEVGVGGATKSVGQELTAQGTDMSVLSEVARRTGGRVIRDAKDIAAAVEELSPVARIEYVSYWTIFAMLGLIFFFGEIALRRSGVFNLTGEIDGTSEDALQASVAQSYLAQAKEFQDQGDMVNAQVYYLKAHSLFVKAKRSEEARRMWERYRLLEARRGKN